jgi:hypothetical protein
MKSSIPTNRHKIIAYETKDEFIDHRPRMMVTDYELMMYAVALKWPCKFDALGIRKIEKPTSKYMNEFNLHADTDQIKIADILIHRGTTQIPPIKTKHDNHDHCYLFSIEIKSIVPHSRTIEIKYTTKNHNSPQIFSQIQTLKSSDTFWFQLEKNPSVFFHNCDIRFTHLFKLLLTEENVSNELYNNLKMFNLFRRTISGLLDSRDKSIDYNIHNSNMNTLLSLKGENGENIISMSLKISQLNIQFINQLNEFYPNTFQKLTNQTFIDIQLDDVRNNQIEILENNILNGEINMDHLNVLWRNKKLFDSKPMSGYNYLSDQCLYNVFLLYWLKQMHLMFLK